MFRDRVDECEEFECGHCYRVKPRAELVPQNENPCCPYEVCRPCLTDDDAEAAHTVPLKDYGDAPEDSER